ncbi:MAG: GtrA family protein [SAR324 cluster bacterium]|nr:GtrA family protein [SAR324 cluster bacterium]
MKKRLIRISRFAAVGGVGFIVDASILTFLMTGLAWNFYLSRAISFSFAVLATWGLNRVVTFKEGSSHSKKKEAGMYYLTQVMGAGINLGVFVLVVLQFPELNLIPVIPLAVGSAVALIFNYSCIQFFVYNGQNEV